MEPTSSVSPSTMYITLSVKHEAVPLHCGLFPGGLPEGLLDGLPFGRYE